MTDIYLSIAAVVLAALGLFGVSSRVARRISRRLAGALLTVGVIGLVIFEWTAADHLVLARLLPFSNVIILGNLTPVLIGFIAAMTWRATAAPAWRKGMLIVFLAAAGLWRSYGWLAAPRPVLADQWVGGVCRQSSDASCSPAAGATLLRDFGIQTSESELADLSLTRASGTSMLGLYRGLKILTRGTTLEVAPFHTDLEGLRKFDRPVLLSVGLPRFGNAAPAIYTTRWGWRPGVRHTVVMYGFTADGKIDIADPAIGRERWSAKDLPILWQGDGIALQERNRR